MRTDVIGNSTLMVDVFNVLLASSFLIDVEGRMPDSEASELVKQHLELKEEERKLKDLLIRYEERLLQVRREKKEILDSLNQYGVSEETLESRLVELRDRIRSYLESKKQSLESVKRGLAGIALSSEDSDKTKNK